VDLTRVFTEFAEPRRRREVIIRRVMAKPGFPLAALLAFGCGVQERAETMERTVPYACASNADCPAGSCLAEFGICTQENGRLSRLLFEVTPQSSDPVYGGARYLAIRDISEAPPAGERVELNVRPRVPVTGRVTAAPELASCLVLARSTLPVTLTFTPREALLGLSLPSYELSTSFDERSAFREWTFQGSLPPGGYDVYMRPDFTILGEDCRAIPQLFRDRSIGLLSEADNRLDLQQPIPSALRLKIAWKDNLEGWRVDMVHPVTGEVLSNRVTLRASNVDATTNTLSVTLDYSRADRDFITGAEELVRLAPPDAITAGTVFLVRSGIEIFNTGEAEIGDVSSFRSPVDYQAWVWKQGLEDTPVPSTVSFAALELEDGVPASFEASASVDATGQVNARLLPGQYRVRVTPPAFELGALGLVTGYESTVTVWPNGDPALDRQGGHVIGVPPAPSLSGLLVGDINDIPLRRVEVRASASNPERILCSPPTAETPEPTCERPSAPVLQRARAQDPFIPRTRTGLTDWNGAFVIDGLDCGRCDPQQPVLVDVTARPETSSGLPWVVRTGVNLNAKDGLAAAPLRIPLPVARPMRVTYGRSSTDPGQNADAGADDPPIPQRLSLSGALVRVFVLLDNQGEIVPNPATMDPCVSVASSAPGTCLQSLLQVAEARTGSEGDFLLLLPPDLE
jgi:hypothetical protein